MSRGFINIDGMGVSKWQPDVGEKHRFLCLFTPRISDLWHPIVTHFSNSIFNVMLFIKEKKFQFLLSPFNSLFS